MCFYCKENAVIPGQTTHVVTLDNCVIIIKNVPCEKCEQCGEKFFSDEVMDKLDLIVSKAKELATEVIITDFDNQVA